MYAGDTEKGQTSLKIRGGVGISPCELFLFSILERYLASIDLN